MLTTQQKIYVASFGGLLIAQGLALANISRVGFDAANKADGLLSVVKKHAENLDADDLQALKNLNLMA